MTTMKKKLHIILMLNLMLSVAMNAQTTLISENFDKLIAGPGQQIPLKWTAKNANNDFASWDIIANNANNPNNSLSAPNAGVMPFGIDGNNDFLLTQMVSLKKGVSYKVRFWYKTVSAATSFEKMSVFVISDTTLAALKTASTNFTNDLITNTEFEKVEFVFKPTVDAPHALVFHSYSDPIMFLTVIDDIELVSPITASSDPETIQLSVAPNPVNDVLDIRSNALIEEVWLIDVQGRVVLNNRQTATQLMLDVSKIEVGNYLLRIKNADGQTISKKIAIQK